MVDKVTLKVKRLPHCQDLPRYATPGSAGMDLTAAIDKPFTLEAGQRFAMPTESLLKSQRITKVRFALALAWLLRLVSV